MARQRLGQHFLADLDWREQIARAIRVSTQSLVPFSPARGGLPYCWVEIGPGHGEMTEYLAATGVPVYAVELDPTLARKLQHLTQRYPNLTIVSGDILQADLRAIAAGRRLRVYGNLPYYITSPILHRIFTFAELIDEMHIVIQTEVAERLSASPATKAYGYLSVATQLYSRPELVFEIPRQAFEPPPEVGSALVSLRFPGERARLGEIDDEKFLDFVKLCFAQKRKTLVNNLRSLAPPPQVRGILEQLGIRPDSRAEQLTLPQFASLQSKLAEQHVSQQEAPAPSFDS
jgi:16S rRNA (adenine1518-N6/adenine1519-N6)-dimethyltransferase